jgi:peptidyl-prolyl cis-trans isomerase SurA
MKPVVTRLALLLIAGAALAASAQPLAPRGVAPSRVAPVDRIGAVVNDEVITQNDLNDRVALVTRQLQRQGGQLPPSDVLTRQILERMINDLLQVQLAKETGIKVDDATLDRTIDRIAQENNLPMTDFRTALERDGVKYSRFREDIRNEILLARLREREVENNIVVTDAEVETELAREAKEKTSDSEFRLAHILVLVPPQATAEVIEQRRRRALQALSELRRGANFAQVAAAFSDAPDALQGGSLGWHLVQVLARRSDELSEDRKRLAARQAIRARKADEAYQDWLRQVRDRAYVDNRLDER